jgi:hypothetical protein
MDEPFCIGCADDEFKSQMAALPQPWPCVGCGKMLRHRTTHHYAETFCSEACADAVYARRDQRHQWKHRRSDGICCASCGVSFRPARRGDASTCSPACRQRLYRKRVTDRSASRAGT